MMGRVKVPRTVGPEQHGLSVKSARGAAVTRNEFGARGALGFWAAPGGNLAPSAPPWPLDAACAARVAQANTHTPDPQKHTLNISAAGRALGRRRKQTFTLLRVERRSESWNSTRSCIYTSPYNIIRKLVCAEVEPIRIRTFACIMPKASLGRFPFPMWRVLSQFVLSLCGASGGEAIAGTFNPWQMPQSNRMITSLCRR